MKPLDPRSRRLIDEVSSSDLPPAQLEEQLWQRLAPRLGDALPPTAAAASQALAAKSGLFLASSPLLKLAVVGLIAGASVTAVVQQRSLTSTLPARDVELARAAGPTEQGAAPVPALDLAASSALTEAELSVGSTLVAETQLLARAQRALRSGKPALALPLIEQHAAAYPSGALAQERDAARVFALCALKRSADARRSQRQFLTTWPSSPLAERVQRACAAAVVKQ